jgi:hypothetical protein
MGFLAGIFGGGGDDPEPVAQPLPEPEEKKTRVDPNRDQELSEAAKQKQAILARRGRSSLVTGRNTGATSTGVSIAGR